MSEAKWLGACGAYAMGGYVALRFQTLCALWPVALFFALQAFLFGYGLGVRVWPFFAILFLGMAVASIALDRRRAVLHDVQFGRSGAPVDAVFTAHSDAVCRKTAKKGNLAEFYSDLGPLQVKVSAVFPEGAKLPRRGEKWKCRGRLSLWPIGNLLAVRKFSIVGKDAEIELCENGMGAFARFVDGMRRQFARRLHAGRQGEECAALLRAMILGEREGMRRESKEIFRKAGVMHVFAISGLHVMIFARMILYVCKLAFVPRRFEGLAALPAVWFYVALTGEPVSAVRAAIMVSISFIAPLFWRRPDSIVAWALAFFIVHLYDPLQLVAPGSVLSFAVMLALALVVRFSVIFVFRPVFAAIVVSAVAWAVAVPICARLFGRISFAGLFASPVVGALATVATMAGFAGIAASFAFDWLAALANGCAALSMRAMTALAGFSARLPCAEFSIAEWGLCECAAWYAALALAFWLFYRIERRRVETQIWYNMYQQRRIRQWLCMIIKGWSRKSARPRLSARTDSRRGTSSLAMMSIRKIATRTR